MPHGADAEGKSVAYADGCVGGSLPHDDRPRQRAALREQSPDTRPVLLDATSHVKSQPNSRRRRCAAPSSRRKFWPALWRCGRTVTGCKDHRFRARP